MSLMLLLFALTQAPQQDATNAGDLRELRQAIRNLSAAQFAVREEAARQLWLAGPDAIPLLTPLADAADDPEAQARARELIELHRFGVTPDTSDAELGQVNRFRRGNNSVRSQVLQELHRQGRLEKMVRMIRAVEPEEARDKLLESSKALLLSSVRKLMAVDEWQRAESLLRMLATTENGRQHWLAFHAARGTLDAQIKRLTGPTDQDPWLEPESRARMIALLYRAAGNGNVALQWARKTNDQALVDGLLIEQGRWKMLSQQGEITPATDSHQRLEQLGQLALIHQWAGNMAAREEVVDAVEAMAPNLAGAEQFAAIEILLVHGRFEAGVKWLKQNNPQKAIYFLSGRAQYKEALEVAGVAEPTAEAAREHIDATVKAIADGSRDRNRLSMAIETAILANNLGWTEVTDDGFQSLAKVATDSSLRYTLIAGMVRADRRKLAFAAANSTRYRSTLFPNESSAASLWNSIIKVMDAQKKLADIWQQTDWLLSGTGPEPNWKQLEQGAAVRARSNGMSWHFMGRAAEARDDLARAERYYRSAAQKNYGPAKRALGDLLRKQEQWAAAAAAYETSSGDWTNPVDVFLASACLRKAGQEAAAERLYRLAIILPLGDSRRTFGAELNDRGFEAISREGWELDLRVLAPRSSDFSNAALRIGDMLDVDDAATSLRMWRQQLLSIMKGTTTFNNTISYARLPCMLSRQAARLDVAAGNLDGAKRKLATCLELMPTRISIAEDLVPALEKGGHDEVAQWLYDTSAKGMRDALKAFPDSPLLLNNFAWMSARCGRDLPAAKQMSKKAVEMAPDSEVYLDTLAEIEYRLGNKDAALTMMRKCLAMDPQSEHFQSQIARFTAGDP